MNIVCYIQYITMWLGFTSMVSETDLLHRVLIQQRASHSPNINLTY